MIRAVSGTTSSNELNILGDITINGSKSKEEVTYEQCFKILYNRVPVNFYRHQKKVVFIGLFCLFLEDHRKKLFNQFSHRLQMGHGKKTDFGGNRYHCYVRVR